MGARAAPDAASHAVLRFSKMHGAGNDFVLLDLRDGTPPPTAELSRKLADRHFGVGCDQIITIEPPRNMGAAASYRIWNSDGSNARQCGNGARCVAAWLLRDGSAHGDRFELDSPAGTHAVECLSDGRFRIAMGVPQFAPQAIPLAGFADAQDEYALDVALRQAQDERVETVRFGAVSMGNPHALVEVDDIDIVPVDDKTMSELNKMNPGYHKLVIKAGTYPKQDKDVHVIGYSTHIVAACDLPEDTVYKMTKTMAQNIDDMAAIVKAIHGVTPKDMALDIGVPFHKGAAKFYKEAGAM